MKRRSDRALASFHGLYGNRGSEAREIRDDEDCTLKTEQRAKDKQGNRRQKFEANCGKQWVTISTDGKPNGACIILENQ